MSGEDAGSGPSLIVRVRVVSVWLGDAMVHQDRDAHLGKSRQPPAQRMKEVLSHETISAKA